MLCSIELLKHVCDMPAARTPYSVQEQVVPRAIRALSRALQLRAPVSGNLKLPRTCSSILTNTGQCARVGEMCWGDLPTPAPEEFYGDTE